MLTREERDNITKLLREAFIHESSCECLASGLIKHVHHIHEYLDKITEKHKPEIKMGNIVKALQVIANRMAKEHALRNIDCYGHRESSCGLCCDLGMVNELLEGEDE